MPLNVDGPSDARDRLATGECILRVLPASPEPVVNPVRDRYVIAQKHGGATELTNLALSCFYCNSYKGPNIAGLDPESNRIIRLYHPRKDTWSKHFQWDGPVLRARTAVGRVTVIVLAINHPDAIAVRQALIEEGAFPPHPSGSRRDTS